VNLPEGRKLEHIPESQMDEATKTKLKEAVTALDGYQAKLEPIVKIIEQLSREAGTLQKSYGDKMTEIYNLSQKCDVIYEIIDSIGTFMEVGIYTSEKERTTQQLSPGLC